MGVGCIRASTGFLDRSAASLAAALAERLLFVAGWPEMFPAAGTSLAIIQIAIAVPFYYLFRFMHLR